MSHLCKGHRIRAGGAESIMRHVEIAETSDTFVILVDKGEMDRSRVEQAVEFLEGDDFAHIPYVDDEEQAEIARGLASMSEEDRKFTLVRETK
jgi:hypothetical protein